MKKVIFKSIFIFLNVVISYSQDLNCSDFKRGIFYIPNSEEYKRLNVISADSSYSYISSINAERFIVERKESTQVEWSNGIGIGEPTYEIINWVDDCSYILTYDTKHKELGEVEKLINENGGLMVSKIKIENNCMLYIGVLKMKSGERIEQKGLLCKKE